MANSSIILNNLDFDTLKNTLKSYLKSQDRFNDYDFDGSNMSVLLDLLSYNTYHNAFYLNMIGNEMFLDSAQLRDSVVSHAKELNYTPRSFKSAEAKVNLVITSANPLKRSITVPKGTSFTSRFATKNYTFTTGENIVITDYVVNSNNTVTFTGSNISLFEGYYVTDTFTMAHDRPQRFVITNRNVDISSVAVTVIEDTGATTLMYNRATSLFDLDSTSKVFFIQGAENDTYEIVFGDGITGRKPKDNALITVEYRTSNGELPNGCDKFTPDSLIDSEANIRVDVISAAASGAVSESIESIKYNAPRHFTTQERAITTEDYENLLKLNFPEVNAVTAYGGEDLNPPQFGKVFVAVDLNEVDGLPDIKKQEYYRFLKPRSPVSIDPVFVNPEYTYLNVNSTVRYNINTTRLTNDDIKTIVSSAVIAYAQSSLNNFNRVFRYSKLVQAIDNSQAAIISNETEINVVKIFKPLVGVIQSSDIAFDIPLATYTTSNGVLGGYAIRSSRFIYDGQPAYFRNNAQDGIDIVSVTTDQLIESVGTVNYDNGLIQLSNVKIDGFSGPGIKVYAEPRERDVATVNTVILNILEEDINLTIVPVRA